MPFVIAFIAALAAFMGWKIIQPACPGGAVVATQAECVAAFDKTFCDAAMARADKQSRNSGDSYSTLSACLDHWPACQPREDVSAYGPKPVAACIVRSPSGGIARIELQYSKRP
ncbi:MAG: hypothetical protein KGL46_03545 [Hyphomicrobiales bacterium]|nr:hypothetical protein [Hyphomicrobiales bacterium]